MVNIKILNKDFTQSVKAHFIDCGSVSVTITHNFNLMSVNLTEFRSFLCFLRSDGCGGHLGSVDFNE